MERIRGLHDSSITTIVSSSFEPTTKWSKVKRVFILYFSLKLLFYGFCFVNNCLILIDFVIRRIGFS